MARETMVALLRGINVGGRKRVAMADLRALFEEAGAERVTTYIQSGNVVFTSAARPSRLALDLERRLEAGLGFAVPVVLRTRYQLAKAVAENPFLERGVEAGELHVLFLREAPTTKAAAALEELDPTGFHPEEYGLRAGDVYLRLPNGVGRAKLTHAFFERLLGQPATLRNWKTVTRLLQLAEEAREDE